MSTNMTSEIDQLTTNIIIDSDDKVQTKSAADKKKDKKKKKKAEAKQAANQVNNAESTPPVASKQKTTGPKSAIAKLALERIKQKEAEDARIKALQEEEDRRIREEEEKIAAAKRALEEQKAKKKKAKEDKILAQKKAGTYMTKSEKVRAKKNQDKLNALKQSGLQTKDGRIVIHMTTVQVTESVPEVEAETVSNLRAPVMCIMGHVDTGKTKLLDNIRQTNVQEGEVGGITQQIGATHFPKETILQRLEIMTEKPQVKLPGILIIDTPGHQAFSNLRKRGTNLCDIAIVVIDLVHGLEPQTIEVIQLLISTKTPFVFALNKVDRLYGWVSDTTRLVKDSLTRQVNCIAEFRTRLDRIIVQIMELGLNAKLYWENDSIEDTVSICPTSAITGEGISELIATIINYCQNSLEEKLNYSEELDCSVMEVSLTEGYGTTLDVILKNGELKEGDLITVSTLEGPVRTSVRNLLTPPPNRESRVKTELIRHSCLRGAIGLKLVTSDLVPAIAGSPIVFTTDDDSTVPEVDHAFVLDSEGVTVHASTLGSLEALLQFLKHECNPPIPVSQANIGPVTKKSILKTHLANRNTKQEFATVLAFNVRVEEEATDYAKDHNLKVFTAEIIYHLFDQYKKYHDDLVLERKELSRNVVVFPCVLKILPQCIFNTKNPIVLGVEILEGELHLNTPLSIPSLNLYVGKVINIQNNRKDVTVATKGLSVSIKINNEENPNIMFGRQFNDTHQLYSMISRKSLNLMKEHFREKFTKETVQLILRLKQLFSIK
jgi:translation initiation factor 5B